MILMSVCAINKIHELVGIIEQLKRDKNYYMKMYTEFNEGIIAGMKVIEKRDKECLHCGSNEGSYCEKCYQELIAENLKLQKRA